MDMVYAALITLDYPDAVTRGLRRTTDQFRAVLERTHSDLTVASRQLAWKSVCVRWPTGWSRGNP